VASKDSAKAWSDTVHKCGWAVSQEDGDEMGELSIVRSQLCSIALHSGANRCIIAQAFPFVTQAVSRFPGGFPGYFYVPTGREIISV
jgi:hypothetical protein